MKLFNRTVRVIVVGVPPTGFAVGPITDSIEISAMRIRFHVKKNLGKHPNKCSIKITNLARITQTQLEKKPLRILLYAGYQGNAKLLFDGDLKRAWSESDGKADVVTELEVGDGARAYNFAQLPRAYSPPVVPLRIVKDAARAMGLVIPPEILRDPRLTRPLDEGFSHSQEAQDALSTVLSRFDYSWSMQNRQLVILRDTQVREGQEFVINQSKGLVHSPKYKESHSAGGGTQTEVTAQCLLYPELLPGSLARIESEFIKRSIKLTDVTSQGDSISGGEDYTTELVGKPTS